MRIVKKHCIEEVADLLIQHRRIQEVLALIKTNEFVPVDMDKEGWVNSPDTIVLGIPDLSSAELLFNAPEWINEYLVDAMKIVALMKPDEFDVEPLTSNHEDEKEFAFVIRMWWD